MNFLYKASIGGLGFLFMTSMAFAGPMMGWYGGGFIGPSWAQSRTFSAVPNNIVADSIIETYIGAPFAGTIYEALHHRFGFGRASYGVLVNGGLQLGYRCDNFRYEAELMVNSNPINQIELHPIPGLGRLSLNTTRSNRNLFFIKGNTSMVAGFFNVFYELYDPGNEDARFVPYIGFGLGYADIHNRLDLYLNHRAWHPLTCQDEPTGCRSFKIASASQNTNAAIAQAILGFNFFSCSSLSWGTDVRYISTNNTSGFGRPSLLTWNFLVNYSFDDPYY